MTTDDLIKKLSKLPENTEVIVRNDNLYINGEYKVFEIHYSKKEKTLLDFHRINAKKIFGKKSLKKFFFTKNASKNYFYKPEISIISTIKNLQKNFDDRTLDTENKLLKMRNEYIRKNFNNIDYESYSTHVRHNDGICQMVS